ncbi:hypothetical protein BH10ACT2_BH10ACT2_14780 [soil metagenome]
MTAVPETPKSPAAHEGAALWWAVSSAIAVMALVFAIIGLWLPSGGSAAANANTPNGGTAAATPIEFDVELAEFFITPSTIEVAAGQPITLHVTNKGTMAHDLMLNGTQGTALLEPGASETIELPGLTADAEAWCTVAGHKAAGMVMTITVVGGSTDHSGHGTTDTTVPGASDADAVLDPTAEPSPDWVPYDPTLQPAPGATEHNIEFHATEKLMEVAPGVSQMMWTFNNTVPGPILRGHLGDLFTITLTNDGTLDHSIDFHASKVAWNDEMRSIAPGESLVYQFQANYTGIWMYHCGTAPALHHIGNGMFGAVIIDPLELAPVDHEYIMIQSELYFGPQGQPGDLTKMVDNNYDAVVFNGYFSQYQHAPIRVETGERIRVWVLDAGPNENSAFHIVGTIFDTVYKEGSYLLQPDDTHGGSQELDLQPAQGGFVEFTFAEDGLYLMVTHKFSNVGKGALGVFQSGEVAGGPVNH